jgi:hypothetical protein
MTSKKGENRLVELLVHETPVKTPLKAPVKTPVNRVPHSSGGPLLPAERWPLFGAVADAKFAHDLRADRHIRWRISAVL